MLKCSPPGSVMDIGAAGLKWLRSRNGFVRIAGSGGNNLHQKVEIDSILHGHYVLCLQSGGKLKRIKKKKEERKQCSLKNVY